MKNQDINRQRNFSDGQCQIVRLKFLVDFLKASGVSKVQVAEKMGLTRQAVHHWFVRDDMKMSQIYSLFEKFGYGIEFSLDGGSSVVDDLSTSAPKCCASSPVGPASISSQPAVAVTMTLLPQESRPNLAFLKSALEGNSISKDTLAERLQIGRATVYNWFKSDDCFLSYIYAAASATGLRLSIRILPL